AAAAAAAAALEAAAKGGKTFTQDEVNKLNAADRRKDKEALAKLEKQLQGLQENVNLSTGEKQTLEENLEMVRGQLRTKEETAKIERKRIEEELTTKYNDLDHRYKELDGRYRGETVKRSWQDALGSDAFNLGQTVAMMSAQSRLVPVVDEKTKKETGEFQIVVDLEDEDSEGKPTKSTLTPVEAVARMKELPGRYGYLFKANVVSGVGGSNSTGGMSGKGDVDLKRAAQDPETYRKLRKENPTALYGQR
ncbi:MAG: hypothetical protein WD005_02795, partial [Haliea sp.]